MSLRVLVFGPTGNVGSIVARTAQAQGAKVFLAMRNTSKPVPGLDASMESEGKFERIEADLTDPKSIYAAAKQTEASSAFIYLAHNSNDHMKATIDAFKKSGVSFIVFLSSFTVKGDLDKIQSSNRIPYIHARVEMNLEEIYGRHNYVALRAGAFATNTLRWRNQIHSREVLLESPNTEYDYITPIDMGEVGGNILANGKRGGEHVVYLYGPQLIAQRDALETITDALSKRVDFIAKESNDTEQRVHSETVGERVIVRLGPEERKSEWFLSAYSNLEEGIQNVQKYTGRPATSFKEWIEGNKSRYSVL